MLTTGRTDFLSAQRISPRYFKHSSIGCGMVSSNRRVLTLFCKNKDSRCQGHMRHVLCKHAEIPINKTLNALNLLAGHAAYQKWCQVLCDKSNIANWAPLNGDGREPRLPAGFTKQVDCSIRIGVVCLACTSQPQVLLSTARRRPPRP